MMYRDSFVSTRTKLLMADGTKWMCVWHQHIIRNSWQHVTSSAPESRKQKCSTLRRATFTRSRRASAEPVQVFQALCGSCSHKKFHNFSVPKCILHRSRGLEIQKTFTISIWLRSSSHSLSLISVCLQWGHSHSKGAPSAFRWLMSKGLLRWMAFYSSVKDLLSYKLRQFKAYE